MKRLLLLTLLLPGCSSEVDQMRACKGMCAPRLVKMFAPSKEDYTGKNGPICICEDRLPELEKPQ
jgi:hypothetical protein